MSKFTRRAFASGLTVGAVGLALSACGGGNKKSDVTVATEDGEGGGDGPSMPLYQLGGQVPFQTGKGEAFMVQVPEQFLKLVPEEAKLISVKSLVFKPLGSKSPEKVAYEVSLNYRDGALKDILAPIDPQEMKGNKADGAAERMANAELWNKLSDQAKVAMAFYGYGLDNAEDAAKPVDYTKSGFYVAKDLKTATMVDDFSKDLNERRSLKFGLQIRSIWPAGKRNSTSWTFTTPSVDPARPYDFGEVDKLEFRGIKIGVSLGQLVDGTSAVMGGIFDYEQDQNGNWVHA